LYRGSALVRSGSFATFKYRAINEQSEGAPPALRGAMTPDIKEDPDAVPSTKWKRKSIVEGHRRHVLVHFVLGAFGAL
jgi:hypothetical protein